MLTTLNDGWNQNIVLQKLCELDRMDFGFCIELKNQVLLQNILNVILSWQTYIWSGPTACVSVSCLPRREFWIFEFTMPLVRIVGFLVLILSCNFKWLAECCECCSLIVFFIGGSLMLYFYMAWILSAQWTFCQIRRCILVLLILQNNIVNSHLFI